MTTEEITKAKAESPIGKVGVEAYSRVEVYGDYVIVRFTPYTLCGIKVNRQGLNKGKKLNPKLEGKYTGFATAKQAIDDIEGGKHALESVCVYDIKGDTYYDKQMGNDLTKTRELLLKLIGV